MPPSIRHVTPVDPGPAEGVVAEVLRQARAEVGRPGAPFLMLTPAPELLASVWALLRESLFVGGPAERTAKEVVATAISVKNSCGFCTDAHATMLHALGEHESAEALREGRTPPSHADAAAWAISPSAEGPFPAGAAPRFIGTALVFEIITRLVKVMATDAAPHPVTASRLGRSVASRPLRERVAARLEPGASLPVLDRRPRWLEEEWSGLDLGVPAWAGDSPVGTAWTHLRATASCGRGLLGEPAAAAVRRTVAEAVDRWGTGPVPGPPEPAGIGALPGRVALGARLAASAALDPGSVTDEDVAAWRAGALADHSVVSLFAFAVVHAADRIQAGPIRTEPAERGVLHA
ncbi:carboxymuconolactone decarboxylase family protein [Glycomyces xiaoerkulensis]|uniref:carboxymuconolactone decarboxylase family protein n=1 Tax=Glycomyces xiaoerkulensis TaxID=2038139 RepID=UPI000C258099|nr:carboxymuconolactone decarboxylase family protein [Glycomyces xiaoerkulensis]